MSNVRSNAEQVVRALSAFKEKYGSYPNEDTITEVLKHHPEAKALLGRTSSNDFFRQLIVTGYVDGESPFFMGYRSSNEVAKDKASGRMLEAGECAFSYVVWKKDVQIPQRAPLLMVPLVPGHLVFDLKLSSRKLYRRVIIGYSDGSVQSDRIDSNGKLPCGGGKHFFDPSLPHWGGKVPRIAWPDRKAGKWYYLPVAVLLVAIGVFWWLSRRRHFRDNRNEGSLYSPQHSAQQAADGKTPEAPQPPH
jgi:hypothetical protein